MSAPDPNSKTSLRKMRTQTYTDVLPPRCCGRCRWSIPRSLVHDDELYCDHPCNRPSDHVRLVGMVKAWAHCALFTAKEPPK